MTVKECKECNAEIPKSASRCKECRAYQGYRRYITDLSSIVALLIALLSVSALTAPIIVEAIHIPNSQLQALLVDSSAAVYPKYTTSEPYNRQGERLVMHHINSWHLPIRIVISNTGDRQGLLKSARLVVFCNPNHQSCIDGRSNNRGAWLNLYGTEISQLIQADDSVLIDIDQILSSDNANYLPAGEETGYASDPVSKAYFSAELKLTFLSFLGKEHTQVITIDGKEMFDRFYEDNP